MTLWCHLSLICLCFRNFIKNENIHKKHWWLMRNYNLNSLHFFFYLVWISELSLLFFHCSLFLWKQMKLIIQISWITYIILWLWFSCQNTSNLWYWRNKSLWNLIKENSFSYLWHRSLSFQDIFIILEPLTFTDLRSLLLMKDYFKYNMLLYRIYLLLQIWEKTLSLKSWFWFHNTINPTLNIDAFRYIKIFRKYQFSRCSILKVAFSFCL